MTPVPYPNLGFDPCPGDLPGYQALAAYAARSATTLGDAVRTLSSAGSQDWRGQAADAFRTHLDTDMIPLVRKATESVATAAAALRGWAVTLASLQDEAGALDRQAAPWREQIAATLRAAGLPAATSVTPPYPASVTPAQGLRLQDASTALAAIIAKADDLHTQYLAAVQRAGSQLQEASNMAPQPPGLFASLWHDAVSGWDGLVRDASEFVHDKALLEFISGVANVVAVVAGLLALVPPLSAIFLPVAIGAAVVATLSDAALAGFDHGSWVAVGLDAAATVAGGGWFKAAAELGDMYKGSEAAGVLTKATTWSGLVSKIPVVGARIASDADRTVEVAPGMFRMIGESLKEAVGKPNVAAQLNAVKDFEKYGVWRAVDIVAGQVNWTASAGGIAVIPGDVRDWAGKIAAGRAPWEESLSGATGVR